ncbi:hypothetical protein OHA98_17900 [Streptomyces sp. NBC_00654]|uniref:hypothetical protein n=1 Tax=Streptomyces sp. NBC_00654 TaxID=2975799 RepID=UPI00224DE886|nr:hypothetical protein [Streptomyces sp. NBC_00654]MCX4966682.1 hypothetical protein [Streptomyces sp. NBC_00654]
MSTGTVRKLNCGLDALLATAPASPATSTGTPTASDATVSKPRCSATARVAVTHTGAVDKHGRPAKDHRFGEYSTHDPGTQPGAYETKRDVGFTPPRDQDLTAPGLGRAA